MIFLASPDPQAIATAIAGVLGRSWSVVVGEAAGGVPVGWEAPSSITVVSRDEDLACGLSAKLGARIVFAQSFPGTFAGQLVVFDKGVRVRGIWTGEDGTNADGIPYPFETDVFDDEECLTIDAGTVEGYCEHLGLRIRPMAKITCSVVEGRTRPKRTPRRVSRKTGTK